MALLKLIQEGSLEEVKAYVKENPKSVQEKDAENGRLVIHEALADDRRSPMYFEKIAFILNAHPLSAAEKDSNGKLPLHYAADIRTSMDILRLLVKAVRIATGVADSDGNLPLYYAILNRSFDAATLLLQKHCGEIEATCTDGSLLHLALTGSAPNEFIHSIVTKVPRCLEMTDCYGDLPLHTAVYERASLYVIRLILDVNPLAIQVPCSLRQLPLHIEATTRGSIDVLHLLHTRYPLGISTMDTNGWLPIHAAVNNYEISMESLDFLFNARPLGLSALTSDGESALHLACRPDVNMIHSTVQWIVEKCPMSIQAVNADREFPLHFAADHAANGVDVLQLLCSKFPGALLGENKDGNLPLHLSVMTNRYRLGDAANVKFLLEQFPEGARRVNAKGQLPLHAACACKNVPIEAIELLVQRYPEGLAQYDKDGLLPFHYACTVPILEHVTTMLKGSILPSSKDYLPALLVACDRDAPLEVIMKLVEHSKELFSGEYGKITDVVESCQAVAGNVPKKRKLCMDNDC